MPGMFSAQKLGGDFLHQEGESFADISKTMNGIKFKFGMLVDNMPVYYMHSTQRLYLYWF